MGKDIGQHRMILIGLIKNAPISFSNFNTKTASFAASKADLNSASHAAFEIVL